MSRRYAEGTEVPVSRSIDQIKADAVMPDAAQTFPTEAEIEAARSPRGGWSRDQLAAWGIPWPPPKGWRRALIAKARGSYKEPDMPDGTDPIRRASPFRAVLAALAQGEYNDVEITMERGKTRIRAKRQASVMPDGLGSPDEPDDIDAAFGDDD